MKHLFEELNKLNGQARLKRVKELEDIIGTKSLSSFGTYDKEVFEEKLKEMNLHDMRKLASKVGINPYVSQAVLKDSLRKAFEMEAHDKRGFITAPPSPAMVLDPKNPKHKEAINLIGDQ